MSTTSASAGESLLPKSGVLLLVALSVAWGLNWPAMKLVLTEMPVWTFRILCLAGGAAGMLILARLLGHRLRLRRSEIRPVLICSFFNVAVWHVLSGYGVALSEAGKAAIIAYTMPLWAALLGPLLLKEQVARTTWVGLGLGLAGLALLLAEDLQALGKSPLGTLAMLGAAFSWALGIVLIKRLPVALPTTSFVAWQLIMSLPLLFLGALLIEGPPSVGQLSANAWIALAYAVIVAMIFCHWAFYKVVRLFPAVVAAVGTLAIPVVGLLSSALLLGEPLGLLRIVALLLVCGGLAAVLVVPSLRRLRRGT